MKLTLPIAALSLGALMCAAALAQESETQLQQITVQAGRSDAGVPVNSVQIIEQVNYRDLDLTTQAGRSQLDQRIDSAAALACDQLRSDDPIWASRTYRYQCVGNAIGSARSQERRAIEQARGG
jgi:UrcA family protein